ncbi:MAG TPA: dockerin type I domain-containing protein [Pseudobacteroides sp.]|nr:dockerin type I domain-containing protein [Pseudobacteroides sp.]
MFVKRKSFKKLLALFLSFTVILAASPVTKTSAVVSQPYKWNNVKIGGGGGFVCGIIYNPTEKGLVYARTDIGGAYIRNKTTLEWEPINDWVSPDEWNLLGVESLATDPVETNRVYIAAGTYTNSWTNMNGYILRSDDYGKTWERTELPFKFGGNMPGRSVGERLMIDPNSNNILYFAARSGNGLWKSTDYGKTWSKVKSFPNVGNYVEDPNFEYTADNLGLCFVVFDSAKGTKGKPTKDIYVGVADKKNPLYVSHDAGETWKPVEGQPTESTFTRHNTDALSIGIPHHGVISGNGILYVTYGDRGGPYQCQDGAVYKYDTNTGIWTDITPPSGRNWDGSPKYENWYGFAGLSVDAQNPDTLIVSSLQSWWPDDFIFRSTDAGKTWDAIWEYGDSWPSRNLKYTMDISKAPWLSWGKPINAASGGLITGMEIMDSPTPKLGWMIGDIEINPFDSDEMMYGTGATIYGTRNLTDWDKGKLVNIEVMATGVEETAVLSLICPPIDGVELISGVGDICGFVHKDLTVGPDCMMTNPTFTSTTGLDYAELNPKIIVRVGNADKERYEMIKKSVGISKDGGKTWSEVQPNVSYTFPSTDENDIVQGGTVAVSADGSTFVWSPSTSQGVLCYMNGGWKAVSTLPAGADVCSDRVNPNVFYAYAKNTFYVSNDGGQTFTAVKTGLEAASAKIKAVPGKEGHVWIPGSTTGLSYTTDGGKTFNKVSGITRCDVVGFGKAKTGEDYLAIYICGETDGLYAVYRSDDMAKSWIRINDDQHQYGSINYSITGDLRVYGRVFVATNGRGIVYGEINGTTVSPTPTKHTSPTPTPTGSVPGNKLSGYIAPDFTYSADTAKTVKAGFNVELVGMGRSAITDKNGYFEITGITEKVAWFKVKISKTGYLAREIDKVIINGDKELSKQASPVLMWAGDLNGDDTINMSDIIIMAKHFGGVKGDETYLPDADINSDSSINMSDVMILAKHFNATTSSYPTDIY